MMTYTPHGRSMRLLWQLLVVLMLCFLDGCQAGAPIVTITPILLSVAPNTASALTRTSRPTITPTPAPSATPDMPLYGDGAWLLFQGWAQDGDDGNMHLWAVNWDGTGLTMLLPDFYVWQHEVQPAVDGSAGRYVAAITSYGWSAKFMFTLAHLPDGEIIANIPLTNPQTEQIDFPGSNSGDPARIDFSRRQISSMSISDLGSLAWSPDGTQIAFSGAQNGTRTEVYRYSLEDSRVSRLTWGQHAGHASNLLWSPDGQYIAYDNVGRTPSFYWSDGIWVVRANGSMAWRVASEDQWPPVEWGSWGYRLQKLGWVTDHTLAVYSWDADTGSLLRLLKNIDVETGRSSTIYEELYCGAAFVSEQDVWLVEIPGVDEREVTLILNGNTTMKGPGPCSWPVWSEHLNAFITSQGLVGTHGEQTILDLPEGPPLISSDGMYSAYPMGYATLGSEIMYLLSGSGDLWIGETGKQPLNLAEGRFEVLQWSANNRSVLVTDTEQDLQYVALAPDFKLRLIGQYDTNQAIGPWMNGLHLGDQDQ